MAKGFKSGGRQAGTPNKATQEFRATVQALMDENRENVALWLAMVANGDPANDVKPDPGKALDLLSKLAEYAAPKLARTEVSGIDGEAIQTVSQIQLVPMGNDSGQG